MRYFVKLMITPDSADAPTNPKDVGAWVKEQFEGCDLAEVEIVDIKIEDAPTEE